MHRPRFTPLLVAPVRGSVLLLVLLLGASTPSSCMAPSHGLCPCCEVAPGTMPAHDDCPGSESATPTDPAGLLPGAPMTCAGVTAQPPREAPLLPELHPAPCAIPLDGTPEGPRLTLSYGRGTVPAPRWSSGRARCDRICTYRM